VNKNSKLQEELGRIWHSLKSLEDRITNLELEVERVAKKEVESETHPIFPTNLAEATENLEIRIGQFWFAKTGIVILALGIVFLLTFPFQNIPIFIPALVGYFLVSVILVLSYIWRHSIPFISRYLLGGGLVLLYFTTLRLHYFSPNKIIDDKNIIILLLLISVSFGFYLAFRLKSSNYAALATTLAGITAIILDQNYFIFFSLLAISVLIVYLQLRFKWNGLFIYGIMVIYFIHFLWFVNNPLSGRPLKLISAPLSNLFFILFYQMTFMLANYLRKRDVPENNFLIFNTFINCAGGYGLFLLISLSRFQPYLLVLHLIASAVFLLTSILFWIHEKSKYSTFFYALLGYSALSIAILTNFKIPQSLIWLCWQSLLVITTALWFRSKIIVLTNFIIFILIFLVYPLLAKEIGWESLSFGTVALISARVMNWQRHRLELKTEFMRNSYLVTAFIMIPYAFYHIVQREYVAISWAGVAIFYYFLSVILNNKKYRWMALLTLLLTVFYIVMIGIPSLDPVYRILTLTVVGIVLLSVSVVYAKRKIRKDSKSVDN